MGHPGPRKPEEPLTTNPPNPRSQPTKQPGLHPPTAGRWAGFTSRRLGVSPCHLAGRSLWASCPSLARGKPSFAILAALGFLRRLDWHGLTPREPVFHVRARACADAIKAPRREPGGRRAVGRSRSPEAHATAHHQPAQSAFTTNQITPLPTTARRRAPRREGRALRKVFCRRRGRWPT